jgi:serine/threonine protein kinase
MKPTERSTYSAIVDRPPLRLPAGTRLGPYEVVSLLGTGGMGEVYRARDARLGRDVAIKVLPGPVAADPDRLRRFEQETRAVGALNHPHILTVNDVGTHGGTPYVVTELLEGETLREVLLRRTPSGGRSWCGGCRPRRRSPRRTAKASSTAT